MKCDFCDDFYREGSGMEYHVRMMHSTPIKRYCTAFGTFLFLAQVTTEKYSVNKSLGQKTEKCPAFSAVPWMNQTNSEVFTIAPSVMLSPIREMRWTLTCDLCIRGRCSELSNVCKSRER